MLREQITREFRQMQANICTEIEAVDGKGKFKTDSWQRAEGGGGESKVLVNGNVLEKAGVNFSEVFGPITEKMKASFGFTSPSFYATGVSVVMHPDNPYVPIIHMNIRYFETGDQWWFGGGIDLTPIYIDEQEAVFFHQQLKAICDKYDEKYYPKFKEWADNYFFIPHRNETRGIGGIFFDRLMGESKEKLFEFTCHVGRTFAPTYTSIIKSKRDRAFNSAHKKWQAIRRSRYVEFNLVYDKGTKFGLETDGRIESILMSMPPVAEWHYNYIPDPDTEEWRTQKQLKKNKAWI